MTGVDLPAGYTILVAGQMVEGTASRGATVTGLPPGTYSVTLRVRRNCRIDGENPRSVTVAAGRSTELTIAVTCAASSGLLRVTTVTTGVDLDVDAYEIRVQGYTVEGNRYAASWATGTNETQILAGIPTGENVVTLAGVSVNCEPVDSTRRSASVAPPETVTVVFTVTCAPASGEIAYVVGRAPGIRHITIITVNGSRVRRLTAGDASDEDPAWSPDGRRIAFTSDRDGNREIYVADADGANVVRLTNDIAADYEPAWSPDGTRIAFVSERAGRADIFVMDPDGTKLVRLTASTASDLDPAWAPDGRIAFASDRASRSDVYVMNADGSGVARLTTTGGSQPAWSPDGTMLAYTASNCAFYYACYPTVVVSSATPSTDTGPFGPSERPSWSPDGRKIAFSGLTCDFYYISCEASVVRIARLPDGEVIGLAPGSSPAWRP